ncbi:hypothetical protein [Dactylosporangium sp. NPDC000521]|uniref:hypothetical protein n=1 Tax=Dactylosporangium sp. NPDC000521 TaxID=3363975 RepID=UPI0036906F46
MRRLPTVQVAVSLLVAAVCGAALLLAVRPAVQSGRTGVYTVRTGHQPPTARQYFELIEYLSAELRRQVAPGTKVRIVEENQDLQLRLIEFAVLHGLVVSEHATVKVYLHKDPTAPHGMWLKTEQLATA